MRIITASILTVVASGLVACTDPGETTTVAAATGGALGAGLGAIIGSQTGSAGGGLVLGALAGAAAGGAVGNVLEGQENTIRTQDEAIERHERTIQAQRAELEELRRINQEQPSLQSALHSPPPAYVPHASFGRTTTVPTVPDNRNVRAYERPSQAAMATQPVFPENAAPSASDQTGSDAVHESTLVDHTADYRLNQDVESNLAAPAAKKQAMQPFSSEVKSAATDAQRTAPVGASMGAMNAGRVNEARPANLSSAECVQAEGEISKASASSELADKLFHYRRALRLCPDNPSYHNGLGEIYLSLNRRNDAEFEFREALNLNPEFQPATNNLNSLR